MQRRAETFLPLSPTGVASIYFVVQICGIPNLLLGIILMDSSQFLVPGFFVFWLCFWVVLVRANIGSHFLLFLWLCPAHGLWFCVFGGHLLLRLLVLLIINGTLMVV